MRQNINKSFEYLTSKKWNRSLTKKFHKLLQEYPLNINDSCPDGE
jgi:hypothetical protein